MSGWLLRRAKEVWAWIWALLVGVRRFFDGVVIAWPSTLSVLVAVVLFLAAPQARDLLVDRADPNGVRFWLVFSLAALFWVAILYVSSSWLLRKAVVLRPTEMRPAAWVVAWVPPVLASLAASTIIVAIVGAANSAPTILDPTMSQSLNMLSGVTSAQLVETVKICGSPNDIELFLFCAAVFRPFEFLSSALTFLFVSPGNAIEGDRVNYNAPLITLGVLLLTTLLIRSLFQKRKWHWIILTISFLFAVSFLILLLLQLILSVLSVWELSVGLAASRYGLPHAMWVPIAIGAPVIAALTIRADRRPLSDGAVRLGFRVALGLSAVLVALAILIHPLNITAFVSRTQLLPLAFALFVAPLTALAALSLRWRAPVAVLAVTATVLLGHVFGGDALVRTTPAGASRQPPETIDAMIARWRAANDCVAPAPCPQPVLVAASGGASRSAFFVSSVIGALLDGPKISGLRSFDGRAFRAFAVSADGSNAFTASEQDKRLEVWNLRSGAVDASIGGATDETIAAILAHPSDPVLFVAKESVIEIWDVEADVAAADPISLDALDASPRTMALTDDGRVLVVGSQAQGSGNDSQLMFVDLETRRSILVGAPHDSPRNSGVTDIAAVPGDSRVLTVGTDGFLRVWSARDGREIATIDYMAPPERAAAEELKALAEQRGVSLRKLWTIFGVAPSVVSNGAYAAVAFSDRIEVFALSTGQRHRTLRDHHGPVIDLAFTPDGRRLFSGGADALLRVWDPHGGDLLDVIPEHQAGLRRVIVTRDGASAITTSEFGVARVWDVADMSLRRLSTRHSVHRTARRLFAFSGVSGGALGSALSYAALAESLVALEPGERAPEPPCGPEARRDAGWYGYRSQDQSDRSDRLGRAWRDCLQSLAAGDFLSPAIVSLLSNDILRLNLRGTRAEVLEHSFEDRFARLSGQKSGIGLITADDAGALARGMRSVRARAMADDPRAWLPALYLSGASASTGESVVATDAARLPGQLDAHSLTEVEGVAHDLRVSTGVLVSARFPLISPAGVMRRRQYSNIFQSHTYRDDYVVDGGYHENLGAKSVLALAGALRAHGLDPALILITNEPRRLGSIDRQGDEAQRLYCDEVVYVSGDALLPWSPEPPRPATPAISMPVNAVLAGRVDRSNQFAADLLETFDAEDFAHVCLEPDIARSGLIDQEERSISMNWWLSYTVQKYLDEQVDSASNAPAFRKIVGWLDAAPSAPTSAKER